MMKNNNQRNSLLFAIIMGIAVACGTSEQVRVVDDSPRNITERDSAQVDTTDQFMQLSVGLLEPVDNFDPLFANTQSSMRVISLIYDGLFSVDENGNVIPAIAEDVTVSDDSLTYTIQLNNDLFFHDSDVFMSGVGRRVQAADIKWAFERTARSNVPDRAAQLLMNVEGYQDYFEDQRYIYDPDRRVLEEVSGIEIIDPQTIRFELIEPDTNFTKKLASPFLLIYPREALQVQDKMLKTNPVGTGAYRFRDRTENTIILIRDEPGRNEERLTSPRLNRIDFVHHRQESRLFQEFASQNIDWIPEIGPETKQVVISEDDSLSPGYRTEYNLHRFGERQVSIYLNDSRRINIGWLRSRLADVVADSITHQGTLSIENPVEAPDSLSDNPDSQYYITYTSDLYARMLLTQIQRNYLEPDSEFALMDIRTPISRTSVYAVTSDPFHNSILPPETGVWLQLTTPNFGLSQLNIEGVRDVEPSWKLFVDQIRINEEEEDTP